SSVASVLGNLGQADYAAANGFMDQFAAYRNQLVTAGRRRGQALSINWTWWLEGGMALDPSRQELLRESTGIEPMPTSTGLRSLHQSLSLRCDQALVMQGDPARLQRVLAEQTMQPASAPSLVSTELAPQGMKADSLLEKTEDYLRSQFSTLLKVPSHRIDPR